MIGKRIVGGASRQRGGKNIEFEIRGNVNDLSQARDIHDFAWAKYWNSKNPKYPSTLSEGVFLPNANIKVVERLPNNNNIYRFILTEY